jgi:SAM-dependent methyltransferase
VLGLAVRAVAAPPPVWAQMSTAHIYGDPPEAICDEDSPFGYGLAPFVGRAWEEAFQGSGREVAWLNANGFPAKGLDASEGLLAEARTRYPQFEFAHAELPDLHGIAANTFDNVLCETVIMHLDRAQIAPSVRRMLEIAKPGGIFYLSWRVTTGENQRDKHERLYAAFEAPLVLAELAAATMLLDEEVVSASSGKTIHRVVVRKSKS